MFISNIDSPYQNHPIMTETSVIRLDCYLNQKVSRNIWILLLEIKVNPLYLSNRTSSILKSKASDWQIQSQDRSGPIGTRSIF